ncbi:MAG: sterol desaturase family protein [Terriglobales bacterium]
MAVEFDVRHQALRQGRFLKRQNAITAALSGGIPAIAFGMVFGWRHAALGFVLGLLWANAFEYSYHRWLLHWPQSSFGKNHLLHHSSVGAANEAAHLTFGDSPLWVAALFAVHLLPVAFLDLRWHAQIGAGLYIGFGVYFMAVEEIHWRVHLGEWLPPGLIAARNYHLAHHDEPAGRFNVFFPVCDYLFGNVKPEVVVNPSPLPAQEPLIPCWWATVPCLYMLGLAVAIRFVFWGPRRL